MTSLNVLVGCVILLGTMGIIALMTALVLMIKANIIKILEGDVLEGLLTIIVFLILTVGIISGSLHLNGM